jgi:succinate dehydrogenase/fumarate reductase-like Fe-S protein
MLLQPYERVVEIEVNGVPVRVPEGNTLLRGFQHLVPEDISYGPFCWNQHCGSCVIQYDTGEGTHSQGALACELLVRKGMRVRTVKPIFGYCIRSLVSEEVAE